MNGSDRLTAAVRAQYSSLGFRALPLAIMPGCANRGRLTVTAAASCCRLEPNQNTRVGYRTDT
jgi:hypothetical protein